MSAEGQLRTKNIQVAELNKNGVKDGKYSEIPLLSPRKIKTFYPLKTYFQG